MAKKVDVRTVVSPEDVLLVVFLVKRFLGKNPEVNKFLTKIDEPSEVDRLYSALQTFVDLIEG